MGQAISNRPDDVQMHVCNECGSDLVYPVIWEEAGPREWDVTLRCPECYLTERGTFDQDDCGLFDDVIEAGKDALERGYKRLVKENMKEEIDLFACALAADAIQPMDF